jgi:uncharacterized protein
VSGARPLQVGVSELLRHPGTRRPFQTEVVLPGLSLTTASVPDDTPVRVDLVLESLSSALTASGTVRVRWQGACRRCLEPVHGEAETEVHAEIFEFRPTEGETYPLASEQIDLEPLIRDAVLLALPLAPLCGEDCRGPAPEAFPTGSTDDPEAPLDPRWAALDDLTFDE